MYVLMNALLLIGIFFNEKKKIADEVYKILLILLWVMLALRYGQGTDYFGYYFIHSRNQTFFEAIYNSHQTHSEVGFRILCWIFKDNFTYLIIFISTIEMIMLHRFINLYSTNRRLSLLLVYPTIYLTYFFSAIREGLVISIFVGLMIDCIDKKKYKTYCLLAMLCCTIHTVSVLLFIVPLIDKINTKKMIHIAWIAFAFGIISWVFRFYSFIRYIPVIGKMINISSPQMSVTALLERLIMFILVIFMFSGYENDDDQKIKILFNIYSLGIICYFLLLSFPLVSSRSAILFKVVEIVLLPILYSNSSIKQKDKQIVILIAVIISLVMTVKNINSYISQGYYNSDINALTYPYVSIFEKDDIWKYRSSNIYYELAD